MNAHPLKRVRNWFRQHNDRGEAYDGITLWFRHHFISIPHHTSAKRFVAAAKWASLLTSDPADYYLTNLCGNSDKEKRTRNVQTNQRSSNAYKNEDFTFLQENKKRAGPTRASRVKLSVSIATSSSPSSMCSFQSTGILRLGDRVVVTNTQGSKEGTLRYLGRTDFALGVWAGVELDEPHGKNDGAVAGKRYFDCRAMHGLFAPILKVSRSPNQPRRMSGSAMDTSMMSSESKRFTRMGARASFGGISDRASVASAAMSGSAMGTSGMYSASNRFTRMGARASFGGISDRASVASAAMSRISTTINSRFPREREQYIEKLAKELEMERSLVRRVALQAEEAENQLAILQRKFKEEQRTSRAIIDQLERQLAEAESVRASMADQIEDLQFRVNEETITRQDLEAEKARGLFDDKGKGLARLSEQIMEKQTKRCLEADQLATLYEDELDSPNVRQVIEDERLRKLEDMVCAKEYEIGQLKDSVVELSKKVESEQLKRHRVEEQLKIVEKDLELARSSLNQTKDDEQHESLEGLHKPNGSDTS